MQQQTIDRFLTGGLAGLLVLAVVWPGVAYLVRDVGPPRDVPSATVTILPEPARVGVNEVRIDLPGEDHVAVEGGIEYGFTVEGHAIELLDAPRFDAQLGVYTAAVRLTSPGRLHGRLIWSRLAGMSDTQTEPFSVTVLP